MPWLINNNTSCKKFIPSNNHNLHIKAIKKIKNHIKTITSQQIKLTNYKNCFYYVIMRFEINNTTDQEHENLKNSKSQLLKILKKHYGFNFNNKVAIVIDKIKKSNNYKRNLPVDPFSGLSTPSNTNSTSTVTVGIAMADGQVVSISSGIPSDSSSSNPLDSLPSILSGIITN